MAGLLARARKLKKTIVFPEGSDPRVRQAAVQLAAEGAVRPVLLGTAPTNALEGVTFVDPAQSHLADKYAALYYERRRAKGVPCAVLGRQGFRAGGQSVWPRRRG